MQKAISINSDSIFEWIEGIISAFKRIELLHPEDELFIGFSDEIKENNLTPLHFVTLACLIDKIERQGHSILLDTRTDCIGRYISSKILLQEFCKNEKSHVPYNDENIFNLWRINAESIESYSEQVYSYLKKGQFRNKDLTAIKNSLLEAYYNIFDHAQAHGNAFSRIQYDGHNDKICFAVCDLGIGIVNSIRKVKPNISDVEAIQLAMQNGFSVKSRSHNMGFGLNNIECACTDDDNFIIISNGVTRISKNGNIKIKENSFHFPGTVIYFESKLNQFPDEEIIDCFVL